MIYTYFIYSYIRRYETLQGQKHFCFACHSNLTFVLGSAIAVFLLKYSNELLSENEYQIYTVFEFWSGPWEWCEWAKKRSEVQVWVVAWWGGVVAMAVLEKVNMGKRKEKRKGNNKCDRFKDTLWRSRIPPASAPHLFHWPSSARIPARARRYPPLTPLWTSRRPHLCTPPSMSHCFLKLLVPPPPALALRRLELGSLPNLPCSSRTTPAQTFLRMRLGRQSRPSLEKYRTFQNTSLCKAWLLESSPKSPGKVLLFHRTELKRCPPPWRFVARPRPCFLP